MINVMILAYLYVTLHSILHCLGGVFVAVAIIYAVFFVLSGLECSWGSWITDTNDLDEDEKIFMWCTKHVKKIVVLCLTVWFLCALIPSKKQLTWIIGAGVGYSVTQVDVADELPENLVHAANTFLKSISDDSQEEN